MINHVKEHAIATGAGCMYWQTKAGNATARILYDSITKNNDYVQYMIKLQFFGASISSFATRADSIDAGVGALGSSSPNSLS